jgi:hypothetical protein
MELPLNNYWMPYTTRRRGKIVLRWGKLPADYVGRLLEDITRRSKDHGPETRN